MGEKTVRVRIAVAWLAEANEYSACGWSIDGEIESDETMMRSASDSHHGFVPAGYITAEMVMPEPHEPREVAGSVERERGRRGR